MVLLCFLGGRCWGAIEGELLGWSRTWLAYFVVGSLGGGVGGDVGGEGFQEAGMGGKLLVGWLTT